MLIVLTPAKIKKRHKKTFFPKKEEGWRVYNERVSAVDIFHRGPFLASQDQT
jgi:hypothetical protein